MRELSTLTSVAAVRRPRLARARWQTSDSLRVEQAVSQFVAPRASARTFPLTTRQSRRQPWQSTATSSAEQTSRIRSSLSRPRRSTRMATETLSTESRLIEDRLGTGSSAGSTTTSLARPRIVVVHGATSGASQARNRRITREHDDRSPADVGQLAPPHLSPCGKRARAHDAAAASRNDARSPQASGSSSGCSS